jgi:tetratricopeptide (TPR) repeat protein
MRAGNTLDANASREAARLNNLGTALMNQQLLERAAAAFSGAAKSDPHLAAAQINEGIAYLYLQKLPEAQQALDSATRAAPVDPHGWYALGLLERTENRSEKALEAFQKVITIDPADPDAYYMAGSVEVDLNDSTAAEADFRKAPSSGWPASCAGRAMWPARSGSSTTFSMSAIPGRARRFRTPMARRAATAAPRTPSPRPQPSRR